MRLVIQRVRRASVEVGGEVVVEIGKGMLVFIGIGVGDTGENASYLAAKILNLRIFEDAGGKMNCSIREVDGAILVVSQFTLYGDCLRGRRPSFTMAASPERGRELYERFVLLLRNEHNRVREGVFGAKMLVDIENDGPVTLILERSG